MDKNLEKLTGTVSVEGDITPTLREPVPQIRSSEWSDLTTSELWEQKSVLQTRISYAHQSGHPELVVQIQRGIDTIDHLLTDKASKQDTLLY